MPLRGYVWTSTGRHSQQGLDSGFAVRCQSLQASLTVAEPSDDRTDGQNTTGYRSVKCRVDDFGTQRGSEYPKASGYCFPKC